MSDKKQPNNILDTDSRKILRTVGKLADDPSSYEETINMDKFFDLLGIDQKSSSEGLLEDLQKADLSYRLLNNIETEKLYSEIKNTIESGKLSKSGPGKLEIWEKGWGENLANFLDSQDLASLKPKFVRDGLIKRLKGQYILPRNKDFESVFFSLIRRAVFEKYLMKCSSIYEFGAGTGHNLMAFQKYDPSKILVGTDWSEQSVDLMNELNKIDGVKIESFVFDMFMPNLNLELNESSGVLTVGALEQLGSNFWPFLFFLLRQKNVKYFVHFETFNEFYDTDTMEDRLAVAYCKQRNYINGFISALNFLELYGIVKVVQKTRTFGSQFHEGYSFIVWELGVKNFQT